MSEEKEREGGFFFRLRDDNMYFFPSGNEFINGLLTFCLVDVFSPLNCVWENHAHRNCCFI